MHPQLFAFSVLAVAVVVVAAVVAVAMAMVVVSLGMILCIQIVRFSCLLKRRNGRTDGPTDGPTEYGRTDRLTHLCMHIT